VATCLGTRALPLTLTGWVRGPHQYSEKKIKERKGSGLWEEVEIGGALPGANKELVNIKWAAEYSLIERDHFRFGQNLFSRFSEIGPKKVYL
jgi:hypothetical protein